MSTAPRAIGGWRPAVILIGCWSLLVLGATSASSQGIAQDEAPRTVEVAIFLFDVLDIDSAAQTALVHFGVVARWHDELLVGKASLTRSLNPDGLWTPKLHVANERRLRKPAVILEVDPDGNVTYRQRFIGTITSPMDVADFPFDRQTIQIEIAFGARREILLEPLEGESGQAASLTVADWAIGPGTIDSGTFRFSVRELPTVVYEFEAHRDTGYYIWKVMLPLVLIVFMSWAVFWIDPSDFGPQIGAATASMLTLIAYRFALGNLVPKISYFTRMDSFITGSTILVFLVLAQAVLTNRLVKLDKVGAARSLDKGCRVAFPAAYAGLLVVSFWL